MKRLFLLIIFLLFCNRTQAQETSSEINISQQSLFTLHIKGIEKVKGEIRIAVFNSKQNYQDKEKPLHAVVLPVKGKEMEWQDEDLPFGNYAIAVYHDRNKNGELDTNFLGIPKEAYGFSNNARGTFGPASWKKAAFEVSAKSTIHEITID